MSVTPATIFDNEIYTSSVHSSICYDLWASNLGWKLRSISVGLRVWQEL